MTTGSTGSSAGPGFFPSWSRGIGGFAGLAILLTGCAVEGSGGGAFGPDGDAAATIARLWWFMLAVSGVIYLVTVGLLIFGVMRQPKEADNADRGERRFIAAGGIALPAIVLTVLLGFNIQTFLDLPDGDGTLEVQVIGKRWWWEVRYPEYPGLIDANEMHIPVGEEVRVELFSDDVNHAFWVPELAGKRDMIPGRTNVLVLNANEPGVYHGQCAELCGLQHAQMEFFVIAQPAEEFAAWAEHAASDAADPDTDTVRQGYETFMNASCAACHTIRGTPADGQLGPDLTHFASRLTIGAGAAPNDLGHLGGWVVNSQSIKPGNLMPPQDIDATALPGLLEYLETLE